MRSWLVVGLGNPGPAFESHRHNVGYKVAEELARRMQIRFRAARGMRAEVAEGRIGPPGGDGPRLILAKSRTFMNETGWAVTRLLGYYKLEPSQMIVVHDELDIDPGQLGQVWRWRQWPQWAEIDPHSAQHRRLLSRTRRCGPTTRPPGPSRFPAQRYPGQCSRGHCGRDRSCRGCGRIACGGRARQDTKLLQYLTRRPTFLLFPRLLHCA
jgi:hypothetical protein